jgi:hypothetical protein
MSPSCWLLPLPLLLALAGCENPKARVMGQGDQDYVGASRAGAETYDRLTAESVDRLLSLHSASLTNNRQLKVAVLGVENKSSEELGDWHEQLYQVIDTSINRAGRYRTISRRFVDAAMRELRLRNEDLFIPAKRRQFIALLEQQGNPVECLLFPTLTSGTTAADSGITQRNYLLTLELVDVETGFNDKVAATLRKEYRN